MGKLGLTKGESRLALVYIFQAFCCLGWLRNGIDAEEVASEWEALDGQLV